MSEDAADASDDASLARRIAAAGESVDAEPSRS
jgi:hypothetical protein